MNIREAHREIWKRKLAGSPQSPDKQSIDRVRWTAELLPNLPSARFLDIGTGSGAMLAAGVARGWEAIGVDFDEGVAAWLNGQGYDVRVVDVSSDPFPFPDSSIDVATCCDVIEHLVDPFHALDEILRVLKPGGACYVTTANYTHWKRVVELAVGTHRGTSGDHVLVDGGHVSYFGATDLVALMTARNFAEAEIVFRNPNPAPDEFAEALMRWAKDRRWIDYTYQICVARKPA